VNPPSWHRHGTVFVLDSRVPPVVHSTGTAVAMFAFWSLPLGYWTWIVNVNVVVGGSDYIGKS